MITSTSNAQIKELAKLQKKSRLRDERSAFHLLICFSSGEASEEKQIKR